LILDYLILSFTLMAIGIYGLVTKYRLLKTIISIEILATATTMNFVLLVAASGQVLGETLLILAFSTDICVSSIIIALLVYVARNYGTTDIRELAKLAKQREDAEEEQKSNLEVH
jgi:NADH:ubiquinone oxidoreductase subunit K